MPLLALLFCGIASLLHAGAAPPLDGFLDRPLPAQFLPPLDHPPAGIKPSHLPEFHSYMALVEAIRATSPKPVIFPEGWLAFVAKQERGMDWNRGKVFFLHTKFIMPVLPTASVRDYLTELFRQAQLNWKYDPQRDALVTDFPWRKNDPRSSRELLRVLLATHPSTETSYPPKPDVWQTAFDSLLNKPENFPRVWTLRFTADDRRMLADCPSKNLVTGPIEDTNHVRHILIVNDQEEICNPGPPGSFSYYLFTPEGRFESGGVYTVGYRCFNDQAWLDSAKQHLDVGVYNNGTELRSSYFAVQDGKLIRTSFLINGSPPSKWQWMGLDSGTTILTVPSS